MPGREYPEPKRREAVALAAVVGAEEAGRQTGIPWRTIRRWSELAGNAPELAAPSGGWQELAALALARTRAAVASGKLPATTVATIAGIAARNAHRDPEPKATGTGTALEAADAFDDWAIDHYVVHETALPADRSDAAWDAAIAAGHVLLGRLHGELIRRANAERQQPHRPALLRFFSREDDPKSPTPAGDVVAWAQRHTDALAARDGTLTAALDRVEGVRHRWHQRQRFRADRAREAAYHPAPVITPPVPDLADLLLEADLYLESTQ